MAASIPVKLINMLKNIPYQHKKVMWVLGQDNAGMAKQLLWEQLLIDHTKNDVLRLGGT